MHKFPKAKITKYLLPTSLNSFSISLWILVGHSYNFNIYLRFIIGSVVWNNIFCRKNGPYCFSPFLQVFFFSFMLNILFNLLFIQTILLFGINNLMELLKLPSLGSVVKNISSELIIVTFTSMAVTTNFEYKIEKFEQSSWSIKLNEIDSDRHLSFFHIPWECLFSWFFCVCFSSI